MKRTIFATLILLAAVSLSACGGGGDASSPSVPGALGSNQGVLTGFGSVFVNGVEFSTTGATVAINGAAGTENQLRVGMVVTVKGTTDDTTRTGTATSIEAKDTLQGTVEAVDAANNSITVMGQTVQVEDNVTRLNDDSTTKTFAAASFQVGDKVEVNAFADDQGGLRATRVLRKTAAESELKGFVTGVTGNSFGLSLTPGGTPTLAVTGALPAGAAAGSFVQIKSAGPPVAGAVTATSVLLEDAIAAAGQKVHVEGIVSSGSVNSFVVNGKQVTTSAATLFDGGLKADFAVGSKVEAEGPIDAGGTIAATKISFRSNIKIEANVTAFTAGSSLTALGKQVAINRFTRIDNGPIAVGSHVEVRASLDRDGNPIASRIVVKNADTRAFLQAPVTAVTANALTIMGTTVTTDTGTEFRVSTDATEAAVGASAFFAQVKPNITVVKVRWNAGNTALPANQAEIELGK